MALSSWVKNAVSVGCGGMSMTMTGSCCTPAASSKPGVVCRSNLRINMVFPMPLSPMSRMFSIRSRRGCVSASCR